MLLASASHNRILRLWDVATGQSRYKLSSHSQGVNDVAFSPDSKLIVSESDNKTARLGTWQLGGPAIYSWATPILYL